MTDTPETRAVRAILGSDHRDPGCDAAFEVFDEYCEAVERGDPVEEHFAMFLTHIRNCADCREDADGLLAALRAQKESRPR